MTWNDAAAYLALRARDARFDGQLFVGVASTRIYCRPICRVRTPRRENCMFFESAARAEAAGFRPCLKCRPELAPAGPAWSVMDASRTLARQAAHWLDEQLAQQVTVSVAGWARALGITDRHLRRIFTAEHGVTPQQYLQTRRLLLAKQLLTDTHLPMTDVASASGFGSVRRFNAAFLAHYRLAPGQLRRSARDVDGPPMRAVRLGWRPPYDVDALMRFLQQRAIPGVEWVDRDRREVRRTVRLHGREGEAVGWVAVRFVSQEACVRLDLSPALERWSPSVVHRVRRWLDLDAVPAVIDSALEDLACPGMRLPGAIDPFELAVRAVLGQQVTVAAARTLALRLVAAFGEPLVSPWAEVDRVFPAPAVLEALTPSQWGSLGITRQRAAAIQALAGSWPHLLALAAQPQAAALWIDALQSLPGIGPWTAHYIAMRALGWPDTFPPGDVAVLKAVRRLSGATRWADAALYGERWSPWRSYAVIRLWAAPQAAEMHAAAALSEVTR
ncbi:AlkA N-terminal domain-containing protein [Caldimonas aquatica]|uniref:DNA-3-methyladenine glycosylase II n=1 Tax=Caldimonas aquatica TaxID=376175 RepID=A0ABY6MVL5_9BURK|nr:AlkA N-terminal domain-containing protein [Schlegelella aquatica]UZD56052.1 helix-turn-helix domain-containing protein [Schlegelella aquatica]